MALYDTSRMHIYIYIYITKGSLLAGYLEFYFAKQRGGLDPLSLNDQEKGTPPSHPLKGNSRHMPCASLHAAAPSQCLIISIIVIILILIIIIIRLEIRFFRHPFSKYPRVRWKWQVRASIGTAKRDIGVCANTDRVFFPRTRCVCLTMYTSKWLFKWTKWWATMDIVGCSLFGSRYLRSALNVQFHAPQVNSRHMPCASLHAAAPLQCLIISIIVIILIIIIIRLAIRIFRHTFATSL